MLTVVTAGAGPVFLATLRPRGITASARAECLRLVAISALTSGTQRDTHHKRRARGSLAGRCGGVRGIERVQLASPLARRRAIARGEAS